MKTDVQIPDLFPSLAFLPVEIDREERIKALAIILTAEGADLNDETDVWRVMFRHGVGPGEAFILAPEAIRGAREITQQEH